MNKLREDGEKVGRKKGKPAKQITMIMFAVGFMANCAVMPSVYAKGQEQGPEQTEEQLQEKEDANAYVLKEQGQGQEDGSGIMELNKIMVAKEELEAREAPDDAAEAVISYHSGDSVYVTGETENGWYRVRYQDTAGYIRMEQAVEMELDVEALDDEFALEESEGVMVMEEVERHRTEARRSKIWGVVIVLSVLGVFATGIISSVKGGKREVEEQKKEG